MTLMNDDGLDVELSRGLLDTNIVILREWIDDDELPDLLTICAVTLGELTAGVHADIAGSGAVEERARRVDALQRVEREFDPIPFDAAAARMFGRMFASAKSQGRQPRRRVADLMIAATAAANGLDLYTTNPNDFKGLDGLVSIIPVTRPPEADF